MKILKKLFYLAGLFAVLALPVYSQAALVSGVFNSAANGPIVVTRVTGPTFLAVRAGYAVEISVSWDDEQAGNDLDPDSAVGSYIYDAPPSGIKMLINGTEYTHNYARGDYSMKVYNNSLDSIWGKIDDVSFRGRVDSEDLNYILVGFSGAGEEVISDDSLPSLAELAAFPYIAGRNTASSDYLSLYISSK